MIRMLLEDMLGDLGYAIAAEAGRIADFDLAILDANLNGKPVSPVADALVARGTPFSLPRLWRVARALSRPFHRDGLKRMLQNALDSGSR
jgi:hypothetical protein